MASATSPPAPQPPEINSALPGSVTEEVKSSPELKEDSPKDEKWAFLEPQPIREEQVKNAVNFLSHPRVRGSPIVHRRSFLERKGLSREEIDEAFRRVPDPPSNEAARNVISPEGKFTAPQPAQTQLGGTHQAVISAEPQPAVYKVTGASPLATVQARARPHWSQLILGAGLLAAAGAGTGYFFQRVLVPKLKAWLREVVLEESTEGQIMKSRPIEEVKIEVQGKPVKLSPMEEAVGAATAAANAAAVAATEVASINRELLKSRTEEWKHLKSVLKSLENQTEDLKSALTIMGRDPQVLQGQVVSVAHGRTDESVGANNYKGSVKALQHTVSPAVQSQMRQGIQNNSKGMGLSSGMDRSQLPSNGHSAAFNSYVSHPEEEPWWRRKKLEVETFTSPKQGAESTVQITEVDTVLDHEIGNPGPHTAGGGGQSRGGPWGRQGWVPPPVPQTVMPGAASAIRYQKPATVDEAKPSAISEEKEMDSQASLGQSPAEVSEVVEVAEASSVDKEVRSSSTKELVEDGVQVPAETIADDEA